jgi:hypothetical protein
MAPAVCAVRAMFTAITGCQAANAAISTIAAKRLAAVRRGAIMAL